MPRTLPRTPLFTGLFLLLALLSSPACAQWSDSLTASPLASYRNFSRHLQENNWRPELAARSLDLQDVGYERGADLAIKLQAVLRARGVLLSWESLPANPNYRDTASKQPIYYLGKPSYGLYLEKTGSRWLISRETVQQIPLQYNQLYPLKVDKVEEYLPVYWRTRALGLKLWQWMGIGLFFALGLLFRLFSRWLLGIGLWLLLRRRGEAQSVYQLKPVLKPVSMSLLWFLYRFALPWLQLPDLLHSYLLKAVTLLGPLYAVVAVYRMVDLGIDLAPAAARRTGKTLNTQLLSLLRRVGHLAVVSLGTYFILRLFDFDTTTLLAGISIGGLAVALAAQDTLKHLFGSVMIFVDKPFQVGNWIKIGETEGVVEEIGLRATRIRTFEQSLVYVPNGMLAERILDNYGLRVSRRFLNELNLPFANQPEKLYAFVNHLRQLCALHPLLRHEQTSIFLQRFGPNGAILQWVVFIATDDSRAERECRHQLMLAACELAALLQLRLGEPSRDGESQEQPTAVQYPTVDAWLSYWRSQWLKP